MKSRLAVYGLILMMMAILAGCSEDNTDSAPGETPPASSMKPTQKLDEGAAEPTEVEPTEAGSTESTTPAVEPTALETPAIEPTGDVIVMGGKPFKELIPTGWQLFAMADGTLVEEKGDLNKDGIDDIAAVIEKSDHEEGAAPDRALIIALGNEDQSYDLSIIARDAILSADEGGVWGDPFESIAIDRGSIVVSHYGGSNWRWYSRYRFRYQDEDWYLIGATNGSYNTGATTIDNADEEDYNLLTGDFSIRRTDEDGNTTTETGRGETHPLIKLEEFDIHSPDPAGTGS